MSAIGVTGTMGCGKSTVCRFLAHLLRVPFIDIDALCRKLLAPGQPGWHALRHHLEPSFFAVDDSLDRGYLRSALFRDADLRKSVDSLIHPLALQGMHKLITEVKGPAVLVDVPLLYEAGWADYFSRVIVVYADCSTCCRRIAVRDAISLGEAARSISTQISPAEKVMQADHVIDNSGCWLFARAQGVHLASLLQIELGTM